MIKAGTYMYVLGNHGKAKGKGQQEKSNKPNLSGGGRKKRAGLRGARGHRQIPSEEFQ